MPRRRSRPIVAAATGAVLALIIAACGIGPTETVVNGCPLATTEGTLEARGAELWINSGGAPLRIEWASGYRAVAVGGSLVLVGPDGRTVAGSGDRMTIPGGFINGAWHACGTPVVEPTPH